MSLGGLAPTINDATRHRVQRRTVRNLAGAQSIAAAPPAIAVATSVLVIEGALGPRTAWAGVGTAAVTVGAAMTTPKLAALASRAGRRPALVAGYLAAAVGTACAAMATQLGSVPLLVVGLTVFGAGQAANYQGRFAATDLAEPHDRAQAMGRVVAAATIGAVIGPLLQGPMTDVAARMGLERLTGPWLLGVGCYSAAAVWLAIRLRPDPLALAGDVGVVRRTRARDGLAVVIGSPGARLGLGAMTAATGSMIAVMAMTPSHLASFGLAHRSGPVISAHVAGMYAFSPLVGRFSDRAGHRTALTVGAGILVVACSTAALSGQAEGPIWVGLFLLGLGWSFAMIGGAALLNESVDRSGRVAAQGTADGVVAWFGGAAGLASGLILQLAGYHALAAIGAGLGAVVLLAALRHRAPDVPLAQSVEPADDQAGE